MKRLPGFTLTELLISMLLALFLLGMAVTAFTSLNQSLRQTQQLSELQQNAQLLMSLLQNELANVGFWGGRSTPQLALSAALPAPPAGDCVNEVLDSGSFPMAGKDFVTLYASTAGSGRQLNCIPAAIAGSEILQLKRLLGQPTLPTDMRQNRFYLETHWLHSRFVDGNSGGLNAGYNYFPYQHLVFYLQQQRVGDSLMPVLMRKRLARNNAGGASISTDSIMDGVERLHFEFGIDTDMDGQLNSILATEQMPADYWLQSNNRIINMRYYALLRARKPDPRYINNQRYAMGNKQFLAQGDHYRRLLVSGNIYFQNAVL
ncbi:PilW family protein [Rheinheimera maricola]|uniref:PilW family protein n=1 Tax=Rheinheimera maricola TaxID=2793282 RepID=A0ABS7XCT0_9GAMM|nr:PilW family protein [Rheinheimera maricola]MBZ9612538.1 PilW family protein [Rheinheimera maricola]